jgi:hypothetical protein
MEEFQSTNNNVLDNGVCVWACVHACDHHFIVIAFCRFVLHSCAWSSFNHVSFIILVAFFPSEQAHLIVVTFFRSFFGVVVHGHFLVIYLHCCALCFCSPPPIAHHTFMGFGCARMKLQGVQSFYNAIRLIILMVFFSSEQVHVIVVIFF